ncbi:MAG: glutamine--fructose-6-phosphate transaminase (isomerizing) [Planctomycetes bacterium]|nr:glutamine--fructose-6-phosphate transaminase (isomerizing) [Planctomycetota bacterium]NOG55144.1 glutamine--fructose-6-phosphate transaminase (isomerizing) [Planctomycetota bacterium]
MCGIVAYIGSQQAMPLLLEGLKRLEYRGYDSAGMAVTNEQGQLQITKCQGRVSVLEERLGQGAGLPGTSGIAHTRWATHGRPSDTNAHPHRDDESERGSGIALVHNGIIENYASLRTWLEERGHTFTSETDTEVLVMLISELFDPANGIDLEKAVQAALREVTGAYAIAVVCEHEPDVLVCARKGSPLMIGIGQGEYIVASDPSAIIAHTGQAFALEDYQVARLTRTAFRTSTLDNVCVSPKILNLELELQEIELGEYPHYMLKEIFEQPRSLRNTLRGRLDTIEGRVVLGGLSDFIPNLVRAGRIIMLGQGTALHAAMIGEYLIEDLAKIPTEVEYASEFRYRNPIIEDRTVVIAISQSGETADTIAALQEAKDRGAITLGAVNVVGSSISRMTDAGVYLRVGPEIGVASTKAFLGQVMVLTLISLFIGRRRFLSAETVSQYLRHLETVPDLIERVLEQSDAIRETTARYVDRENWLFLGRGTNYPVAMEGALKLKEISYIHAEGMPAAEMKHGPIALINDGMPAVFVATRNSQYDKVISNMHEVRARGGRIIAVATEGDQDITAHADDTFYVPDLPEALQPLLTTVPLQLMAYHAAVLRGHDVDKPRNLAKSVTVE